jgi:NAD(P)-dependent dehydrogenase (short-subunit alcohol dehydrogenase family)
MTVNRKKSAGLQTQDAGLLTKPQGAYLNGFPDFNLIGQVALVTGAARGLGKAISLALANAGADVALGLRDVNAQGDLAAQIEALGRRVIPLQMDMRHLDQIFRAVDDTVGHFGRIDILVNNAGLAPDNLAENVREEDFDLTLAVNLKGTFFASQSAGRVMIRQKSGRIINLSSQAGFVALPTESVYCMTKAAIVHLTKCLAVEWGKYNITVNAVAPTFIHSGDGELSCRSRVPLGRSRTHCCAAPHWGADGRGGRGRIPCLECSFPHHGRDHSHRRRVDRQVGGCSGLAEAAEG